jgi:tRNA A37 threonylcarbamoyladenosine synthetase subunit TsaC/SUA5/YrdC
MITTHFYNATLNKHGVDVTTDKGDRFGIACPDEQTARTIAAGLEAVRLLATVAEPSNQIKQLLTSLQP